MTERWSAAKYQAHLNKTTTEAPVVNDIRKGLEAYGYTVAVVSQRGGKGSGTTTGYPDMSVRHSSWARGLWVLLEVKRPVGGRLSPAQAALHDAGGSWVVRSLDEALEAVRAGEVGR